MAITTVQHYEDRIEAAFDSSAIPTAVYYPIPEELVLYFSQKDAEPRGYMIQDVDSDLFLEFMEADSQGRFFNAHLRNLSK